VFEPGLDGFAVAHAKPRRFWSLGSMREAPELPVQVVQPVHLAVSCQCVPLDLLPLERRVKVAPV
jgi:hypothetical protein